MASFNQEQVRHFREVFKEFSNEEREGIVDRDNFLIAVNESLSHCTLSNSPNLELLAVEFDRLVLNSGVLSWQQFFQVLIHINLNDGTGVRASAIMMDQSPPPEPIPPPRSQSVSQPRVTFSTSVPEPTAPPPFPPSQSRNVFTSSLRRMGEVVGNFFGVTEASQQGTVDTIGWEEFTERRVEESNSASLVGTLTRRASLRRPNRVVIDEPPPPDYPFIADGRSFNMDDLRDSDSDEDGFVSEAPPNYADAIQFQEQNIGVRTDLTLPGGFLEQQQYPVATHPTNEIVVVEQVAPTLPPRRQPDVELIHDKKEAWDYYQKFIKVEKKVRRRRAHVDALEFFGDATASVDGREGQEREQRRGSLRRDRLSSIDPSTDQVQRRRKKKKRTKLQRQSTLIRNEVDSLPSFWPVCTILITLAQVVAMIVLLPLFGLAPIDVFPRSLIGSFPTLNGTTPVNISYFRGVNLWIGPTARDLVRFGAKFTPCMRTDFGIRRRNAAQYDNFQPGCCRNQEHIGTVLSNECGVFFNEPSNDTGFQPVPCSSNESMFFDPTFHPCCISITGLCMVMSFQECEERNGYYHPNNETCLEVNCFESICGFNKVGIGEEGTGIQPTAQQFWRWFLSIFLQLGIIHLLVYMPIQLYLGIKIERTVGWLRFCIIYLLSGVGGNIISGVFIPYGVNCGVGGAVFGLLAVLYVELFQFWQIVDKAWLELLKLTAFVVFFLALGTLPYVDNFAQIGGLLFGVPSAIVFVPYITFGKWDAARKRILLIICVPLLILLYLAGFFTFYFIPDPSFCPFCHYINCVPYATGFCPEDFITPNATVFGL